MEARSTILASCCVAAIAACGGRTAPHAALDDKKPPVADASGARSSDLGPTASHDIADAGRSNDLAIETGGLVDAAPPADDANAWDDVVLPPIVGPIEPPTQLKGGTSDCPDGSTVPVYLISLTSKLIAFYPPTMTYTTIGTIACPAPSNESIYSMAVDRTGTAYVLLAATTYPDVSNLFRVNTASASCESTGVAAAGAAALLEMAYVRNSADGGETLYAAVGNGNPFGFRACMAPPGTLLFTVNTDASVFHLVGTLEPSRCSPRLTATASGELFGFYSVDGNETDIGQIDTSTARVIRESRFDGGPPWSANEGGGGAWTFVFWGGDFYMFTWPYGTSASAVTRFRPSDGSFVALGAAPEVIITAGVSTCAPQQ